MSVSQSVILIIGSFGEEDAQARVVEAHEIGLHRGSHAVFVIAFFAIKVIERIEIGERQSIVALHRRIVGIAFYHPIAIVHRSFGQSLRPGIGITHAHGQA